MVWGGRRLGDQLGKTLPSQDAYGESWEISDHTQHRSIVASGPLSGQSLRQLMERRGSILLGKDKARYTVFPWLVKFLDARDWLSVQVHPDDVSVKRLWPGEGGKTEVWFVLDAEPRSRIYAGLLPGVDEQALRKAVSDGAVAECLHQFQPSAGDCLFLPAGTVHAVGGGVLMAEVQQTSDATFRLFDWNRKDGRSRLLHIEQALACIDWQRGPVNPIKVSTLSSSNEQGGPYRRQPLVQCPYFELEHLQSDEPLPLGGCGRMQVVLVVNGKGSLESSTGTEDLVVGQTLLLPADMPAVWCKPNPSLALLQSSLP
jgi:mannose-6-phosphate isomerase